MYYAEKIINGVMHYRCAPEDTWELYDMDALSQRYASANEELRELHEEIKLLRHKFRAIGALTDVALDEISKMRHLA